jgi:hypothetical protein
LAPRGIALGFEPFRLGKRKWTVAGGCAEYRLPPATIFEAFSLGKWKWTVSGGCAGYRLPPATIFEAFSLGKVKWTVFRSVHKVNGRRHGRSVLAQRSALNAWLALVEAPFVATGRDRLSSEYMKRVAQDDRSGHLGLVESILFV